MSKYGSRREFSGTVSGGLLNGTRSGLTVQDEGVPTGIESGISVLNFEGGGVTVVGDGPNASVTIPGGAGASFDPLDPVFLGTGTTAANGGTGSVTIGVSAATVDGTSTAVGGTSNADSLSAAFGSSAQAGNTSSTAIGAISAAEGLGSSAFGSESTARGGTSLALGFQAQTGTLGDSPSGEDCVAIGAGAVARTWVSTTRAPLAINVHSSGVAAGDPTGGGAAAPNRLRVRINGVNYTIALYPDL